MLRLRLDCRLLVATFVSLAMVTPLVPEIDADTSAAAVGGPRPAPFVLRIAYTDDGLNFADTGEVFLQNASAPDLVRLPDQDLLAIFDYHDPAAPDDQPVLSVSRSRDEGLSWSVPSPIRFQGIPAQAMELRYGTLVAMPSGLVRLFCHATETGGAISESQSAGFIASAVTRNGLDYVIDREVRIPMPGSSAAQPTAAWIGDRLDLLIAPRVGPGEPDRTSGTVHRYSSPDGRHFDPAERIRLVGLIGNIVYPEPHRFRMYFSYRNEILSMGSLDGIRWGHEPDVRLRRASDPAIVPLRSGKLLMLYVAPADVASLGLPQKALADMGDPAAESESTTIADQIVAAIPVWPFTAGAAPASSPGDTSQARDPEEPRATLGPDAWEPFTTAGYESELGPDAGLVWVEPDPEGFAPLPDLKNRIDYVRWYESNVLPARTDNAFYSYGAVLGPREDPGWEALSDRYNDSANYGPPSPWNPADWPKWEQSYQTSQGLIAQFRFGSRDTRWFSCPAIFAENTPESNRLMVQIMLPSLANSRAMAKAALSQAWRAEAGFVSPDAMRDSWEMVLGNARHLRQGATLIENLVGIAEASLAQYNARWALERNVFMSAEELERALRSLRASDLPEPDPGRSLLFEHVSYMDMIQHLFVPDPESGEPRISEDRARYAIGMTSENDSRLQALLEATADDAREAIEVGDQHYRRLRKNWQIGYPTVRANQMSTKGIEVAETNPLTRLMLPSLARPYLLTARQEASRRATQLAYAAELFNARNGRYPINLDELPYEYAYDVRTDPFTGSDFGYKIRNGRATIYSLSENATDDGGLHAPRWDDTEGSSSDDFVFYPPQE